MPVDFFQTWELSFKHLFLHHQKVKTKVIDWWSKYETAKQKQKQIIIDRAKRLNADPEIPTTPDCETTTTTHSLTVGTDTASTDPLLIGEVEIFACELEKTRHFRGMFSAVDTFPLYKGKNQSSQATATDSEVQCRFKGQFMLYENSEELQDNFSHVLNRNDGSFFCLKPPNGPVRVMLHVYVVKATIFGSLNERESCYSYLSYKLGGKWTYDPEKQALNTLSPVFGK